MWITVLLPLVLAGIGSHAFHRGSGGQLSAICRQAPHCCPGHVCRPYQRRGTSRPVAACAMSPDSRPLYAPGSRTQRRLCSQEATLGGRGQAFGGRSRGQFGRSGLTMPGPQSSSSLGPPGTPGDVRRARWGGRDLPSQLPSRPWDGSPPGGRIRMPPPGFSGLPGSRSLQGAGFRGSRSGLGMPPVPQFGDRLSQPGLGRGFDQSTGFGQPRFGQPGLGQASLRQPEFRQPGLGQQRLGSPGLSAPGFGSFQPDVRSQQLLGGQLNTFADVPQDQRPFIQGQPSFGQVSRPGQDPRSFDQGPMSGASQPSFSQGPMPGQGPPSFGQAPSSFSQSSTSFGQAQTSFGQSSPSFGQAQTSFGQAPRPGQGQISFSQAPVSSQGQAFSGRQSFGPSFPRSPGDLTQSPPGFRGQMPFNPGQMDMTLPGGSGQGTGFSQMQENILLPPGGLPQSFLAEQPPVTATAIGDSQVATGGQVQTGSAQPQFSQSQTGSVQPEASQSQTGFSQSQFSQPQTGSAQSQFSQPQTGSAQPQFSQSQTGFSQSQFSQPQTGSAQSQASQSQTGFSQSQFNQPQTGSAQSMVSQSQGQGHRLGVIGPDGQHL